MTRVALLLNLIAYAVVVSQPIAYLVFLGKAQLALSPAAYIELRQRINPVMTRRVPVIYVSALAAGVLLIVLSFLAGSWISLAVATIALVCLAIDIFFMMRENVPINGVMDRWSTTVYPEDWEHYRSKWFEGLAYRQVVLLVGFFSLLVGAVFQP